VDVGDSPNDNLWVIGSFGDDRLTIGAPGGAVNADTDVDITVVGADYILCSGRGGNDWISARGGSGTGEPSSVGVQVVTEEGRDRILDGLLNDSLSAGRGQDVVVGGTGNDFVKGGAGDDRLLGGTGRDELRAGRVTTCAGQGLGRT
jgi:Ca2+-binding RTX toxin-like protein